MTNDSDIPMNGSDLLYLFLDGHAGAAEKDALFRAMANDSELQAEFEDAITIRSAIHHERENTVPPSDVTAALFAKAGIAVPVIGASIGTTSVQSGAFLSGLFGKIVSTFIPVAAVGITSVAAFVLWNNAESNERILTDKKPIAVSENFSKGTGEELLRRIERLEQEQRASFVAQNELIRKQTDNTAQARSVYVPYVPKGFALVAEDELEYLKRKIAASDNSSVQLPVLANNAPHNESMDIAHDITNSTIQANTFSDDFSPSLPSFANNNEMLNSTKEAQDKFSFNIRTINGIKQYPNRDVNTPDILFNNLAITSLYDLTENHSVGFDLGQETFPIYEVNETNNLEQRYSLLWGGAAYRYRMDRIEGLFGIQPFVQMVAGGTKYGPITRSIVGITWQPHNNFSFSFGMEGTVMMYSYRNVWYGAQKLGLSYGVNIHL